MFRLNWTTLIHYQLRVSARDNTIPGWDKVALTSARDDTLQCRGYPPNPR